MDTNGIIILNRAGDNIALYVNSYKKGCNILHSECGAEEEHIISLQNPELNITLTKPGKHVLYCIDKNNKTNSSITIDMDYVTLKERCNNLLIANNLNIVPYTDLISHITQTDYIVQLYEQYIAADENKTEYEEILSMLTKDYNDQQEVLNFFVNPLFILNHREENITSYYQLNYTYIPYRYDAKTQTWNIVQGYIKYDANTFACNHFAPGLYKIVVTSDNELIRSFYWYEPTAEIKEKEIQDKIALKKIATEKGAELISLLPDKELEPDIYQTVAAILDFDIPKPVLRKPEIDIDQYLMTITIPDYELMILSGKTYYLALLEIEEIYAVKKSPHRILIPAASFQFNVLQHLPNSDTEYVAYIIDEANTVLSQSVFVSFDTEYQISECINTYRKIELDRYIRKLYTIFKEYDPKEWEAVSLASDRYFLKNENTLSFSEFILTQLTYLDSNQYNIGFIMQLVLLCDLQYFMDIDQSFVTNQVYSVPYKMHVFPRSDSAYIICAIRIYNGELSYQYYLSGNAGTEIRIDRGDAVILQAIDPTTWKKSSIAFYNNKYPGAPYFYFPKLEVTVDGRLS